MAVAAITLYYSLFLIYRSKQEQLSKSVVLISKQLCTAIVDLNLFTIS